MAELQIDKPEIGKVNAQEILDADEWYDLLPVEKKLISYTLILGLGLMVIFIFIFGVFN